MEKDVMGYICDSRESIEFMLKQRSFNTKVRRAFHDAWKENQKQNRMIFVLGVSGIYMLRRISKQQTTINNLKEEVKALKEESETKDDIFLD